MEKERAVLLGELLTELAEDPKGWLPDEVWGPANKAFALPYIELAVVRYWRGQLQILLAYRSDKDWHGWHIPGALWRTKQSLEECVAITAKAELGTEVKFLAKGTWEKWMDDPLGRWPMDHVVICSAPNFRETHTICWFSGVPKGMIDDHGHHARYINAVFRKVKEQGLLLSGWRKWLRAI
jgi:hypothetical protein